MEMGFYTSVIIYILQISALRAELQFLEHGIMLGRIDFTDECYFAVRQHWTELD